ncbi:MAG: hypothetical protein P4L42_15525 [Desulfocapsaceae bacterium]|nr:hypothetical protein [Desulfocapsaceae bacterium]
MITDPKISAALISAAVSILTVILSFLLKAWFERNFLIFKLDAEHRYDQKKKIKEVIAKNKTSLLDAAESLNHRFWNFSVNYGKEWHTDNDFSDLSRHYYLASFAYRILSFFSWVRRIETQMVFLDTTVASSADINFMKFLRVLSQVMCDTMLFKGLDYDDFHATDHFFKNDFNHMCESFWKDESVPSYADFKETSGEDLTQVQPMLAMLSGIGPHEKRLRWDRLQALHYLLLMFLNSYGYDFQYTSPEKIKKLVSRSPRPNKTISNLRDMLGEMFLATHKEVKKVLDAL